MAEFITQGSSSPPGLLMPGDSGQITFYSLPLPSSVTTADVQFIVIDPLADSNQIFPWDMYAVLLNRGRMPEEVFQNAFDLFKEHIGSTVGQYQALLQSLHPMFPESSSSSADGQLLLVQEAFDRFVATQFPSIKGRVDWLGQGGQFESLKVTATHRQTQQAITVSVRSNGSFIIPYLMTGVYDIVVVGDAVLESPMSYVLDEHSQSSDVLLTVIDSGSLYGVAVLENGVPASDAVITLRDDLGRVVDVLLVNTEGQFASQGLRPGDYTISAVSNGYIYENSQYVIVQGNADTTVQIELVAGSTIQGYVSATGTAEGLAHLEVRLQRESDGQLLLADTDEEGFYSFRGIGNGEWRLLVSDERYQSQQGEHILLAGETTAHIDIEVRSTVTVSGVVRDAEGVTLPLLDVFAVTSIGVLQGVINEDATFDIYLSEQIEVDLFVVVEGSAIIISRVSTGNANIWLEWQASALPLSVPDESNLAEPGESREQLGSNAGPNSRSAEAKESDATTQNQQDHTWLSDLFVRAQNATANFEEALRGLPVISFDDLRVRLETPLCPDPDLCREYHELLTAVEFEEGERKELAERPGEYIDKIGSAFWGNLKQFFVLFGRLFVEEIGNDIFGELANTAFDLERLARATSLIGFSVGVLDQIALKAGIYRQFAENQVKALESYVRQVPEFDRDITEKYAKRLEYGEQLLRRIEVFNAKHEDCMLPVAASFSVERPCGEPVPNWEANIETPEGYRLVILDSTGVNLCDDTTYWYVFESETSGCDGKPLRSNIATVLVWQNCGCSNNACRKACDSAPTRVAFDPNDILGPSGFGEEQWVAANQPLSYTIRFKNDPGIATAPAQVVRITQKLDGDLDYRSFRLGDFAIGELFVDVPDNRAFYVNRLDLRETYGIFVDVSAGIDVVTGEAFWELRSIDPATGDLPVDALSGFLPPNLISPEGEGFVSYTVRPKSGLQSGTVIDAEARIIFDVNEPIDTPPIFNTLDTVAPTSAIEALPAVSAESTFLVKWSGIDDANGSGLDSYSIYVAIDGGPWTAWLSNTSLIEALYVGEQGRQYAFYSLARDNAGNVEISPSAADAVTTIPVPIVANAGGPYEISEGDTLLLQGSAIGGLEGTVLTYSWDIDGDGVFGDVVGASAEVSWQWLVDRGLANGPGTLNNVRVQVSDGSSIAVSDPTTLTINNAAPVASLSGSLQSSSGNQATIRFVLSAQDPSPADQGAPFTFDIDWNGDGTVDTNVSALSGMFIDHTFATGAHLVRIAATDQDGGTSEWNSNVVMVGTQGNDILWAFGSGSLVLAIGFVPGGGLSFRSFGGVDGTVMMFGLGGDDYLVGDLLRDRSLYLEGSAGDDILVGGDGDDTLDGGSGNDVMIGNAGNDQLLGGEDRDILVGGDGADSLQGGDGQDLLYSGRTTFDQDAAAMLAIRDKWRSEEDYSDRVTQLSDPNADPRAQYQFEPGVTALDDDDVDYIFGGEDTDWLLLDIGEDLASDVTGEEIKTNIATVI